MLIFECEENISKSKNWFDSKEELLPEIFTKNNGSLSGRIVGGILSIKPSTRRVSPELISDMVMIFSDER